MLTCRVSIFVRKSQKEVKLPAFLRLSMMFATAASPTFAIAESPSLMTSPTTVKSSRDSFMSGGRTGYPASLTLRMYWPRTSIFDPIRLER